MHFPVSGVDTPLWLPPLTAFCISFFTSMGGVSGAFLLLPFQVSVLGYVTPSVSATNHVFNIAAIPGGVYRYLKEGRLDWPLARAVALGTLPGVILGAWLRVTWLPDPKHFKIFAGLFLSYLGLRMAVSVIRGLRGDAKSPGGRSSPSTPQNGRIGGTEPGNASLTFPRLPVMGLAFLVGIAGGIYGIGGGAVIAPFLVVVLRLPVHAVAGAALLSTFLTSVIGVIAFHALAMGYPEMNVSPDWALGLLFGAGGFAGIYLGARCQKHVPERIIQSILAACVLFVALRYLGA